MRRSMMAVGLLLWLSPWPASACIEHDPAASGWLQERPRSAWERARGAAEETKWEPWLGAASLAAGSAAMVLVAVWLRAASHAARRGRWHPSGPAAPIPRAVAWDRPTGLAVRVDQGHETVLRKFKRPVPGQFGAPLPGRVRP